MTRTGEATQVTEYAPGEYYDFMILATTAAGQSIDSDEENRGKLIKKGVYCAQPPSTVLEPRVTEVFCNPALLRPFPTPGNYVPRFLLRLIRPFGAFCYFFV